MFSKTLDYRVVEPEWLDQLPAEDIRAVRSRRDLMRLNACMGNARFIARVLQQSPPSGPANLADLGSGDGTFMLAVARQLAGHFSNVTVTLLDRQGAVSPATLAEFNALGWNARPVAKDIFDWLAEAPPMDAMVANLFLHHFETGALGQLLALASQKTRLFIACEPRRSRLPYWSARCVGVIGAGPVTLNDAPISVLAGFRNRELMSLWPAGPWECREFASGIFSHLFVAQNKNA